MNKKTIRIAGWALGLSMAVAGIGAAVGGSFVFSNAPQIVTAADNDVHDMSISFNKLLNNNATIDPVEIEAQSYPIKSITINWKYNKTTADVVTISVSVGGTSWGSKNVGTNTTSDAVFSGEPVIGDVSITFANNAGSGTGKGTFYVNSIKLTEGEIATSDPAVKFSSEDNYLIAKGDETTITAEIANAKGTEGPIVFSSSDETVATINPSTGLVTAVGKGQTTITASATGAKSKSMLFSVLSNHTGLTESDALTGTEAKDIYNVAGDTTTTYYVGGIVTSKSSNSYYIDDGDFEFYNCTAGAGVDLEDIVVGTYIRASGKLTIYSSQVEFSKPAISYVHNPEVTGIVISGSLTTSTYRTSTENWDTTGLTVSAVYDIGEPADVTSSVEWSFDVASPAAVDLGGNASKTFDLAVTASYEEQTDTVSKSVTVNLDALTSLAVSGQQTDFTAGDAFTLGTGTLKANHSSNKKTDLSLSDANVVVTLGGDPIDVSSYVITSGDNGKTVDISYTERGVTKSLSDNSPSTVYTINVSSVFTRSVNTNTFGSETLGLKNEDSYPDFDLDEVVHVSKTVTGSNGVKYFNDYRMYQDGSGTGHTSITLSLPTYGYNLVSAKFTFSTKNGGALVLASDTSKSVTSGTAFECTGKSVTFTVGNTGSATNGQVKITAIEVKYQYDDLGNWAQSFLGDLSCDASGVSAPSVDKWDELGLEYLDLTSSASYVKALEHDVAGDVVERAMAKYDYIVGKYNTKSVSVYDDFIERVDAGHIVLKNVAETSGLFLNTGDSNLPLIITLVSGGILLTGGAFLFTRRRRNED